MTSQRHHLSKCGVWSAECGAGEGGRSGAAACGPAGCPEGSDFQSGCRARPVVGLTRAVAGVTPHSAFRTPHSFSRSTSSAIGPNGRCIVENTSIWDRIHAPSVPRPDCVTNWAACQTSAENSSTSSHFRRWTRWPRTDRADCVSTSMVDPLASSVRRAVGDRARSASNGPSHLRSRYSYIFSDWSRLPPRMRVWHPGRRMASRWAATAPSSVFAPPREAQTTRSRPGSSTARTR